MTFDEILKSKFLEQATAFSIPDVAIALVLSLVLGLFIYFIYKKTNTSIMISPGFALSLVGMALITTLVILAITSNVILSLGMVGALSIVRFRSAIKDPLDIVYMFWAISVGIVTGAGLIPLAVIGSLFIGLILVVFSQLKKGGQPYLLVLQCRDTAAEEAATAVLDRAVQRYRVKSKTVSVQGVELNVEVRLQQDAIGFINRLADMDGVSNTVLVSIQNEYLG